MRKKVPKYVKELLRRRTKYVRKMQNASTAVDEYCESIGLDCRHPLFEEACLVSDIRIYCEVDCAEKNTLAVIEKVLNSETE